MEAFFVRVLVAVLTSKEVKALLKELMKDAVMEGTEDIRDFLDAIPEQIEDLEKKTLGNIDGLDGKVGNLQEQLTSIPGQIIEGVGQSLHNVLNSFNPFGPR